MSRSVPRNRTARSAVLGFPVRRPAPRSLSSRSTSALRRRIVLGTLVLLALALITVSFRESSDGPLHDAQGAVASALQPLEVAVERVARPFRDAYGWTKDLFSARSENEELQGRERAAEAAGDPERVGAAAERRPQAPARLPRLAHLPGGLRRRRGRGDRTALVGVRAGDRGHRRLGRRRSRQRGGRDRGRVRRHGHEGDRRVQRACACSPTSRAPSPPSTCGRGQPASSCTASPATRSRSTGSRSARSSTSATRSSPPAGAHGSLASLYPKGIPIGRVSFVGGLSTDLWQQVLIESDVDFSSLDSVLVLVPRRPTPELP